MLKHVIRPTTTAAGTTERETEGETREMIEPNVCFTKNAENFFQPAVDAINLFRWKSNFCQRSVFVQLAKSREPFHNKPSV